MTPQVETISPRVRRLLRSLSLRDKVAQLVMPWMPGTYAAFDDQALDQARMWVDSLHVGGIIISIGSPLDIAAKLNFLQSRSHYPLLIASDLEGGTAFRFQGGTAFPMNMGVGASGREEDAFQMGRITALEGRAVGIHLTFSPVADVNSNPANPVINTRSFGADPAAVARLVAAAVKGIRRGGMLATAKHFPGHGDTDIDSHLALPVVRAPWSRLDSVELVPFRAAIGAGVDVVMSAHVALPAVDSTPLRPATVSPQWMTGVLRDSLGFHGLTVTDALNMAGIVKMYGAGEAAVQAFLAGSDLLLQPADPKPAIDALVEAVQTGRVTRARLDRSVARLLAIKERLGLFRQRLVRLDRIPVVVGQRAFHDTALSVSRRALVLVRDDRGALDSLRATPRSVALVTYSDGAAEPGGTLSAQLSKRGYRVTPFKLVPASGSASYDSARALLRTAPFVIFAPAVRALASRGTIALSDSMATLIEATARERPTVVVSFGNPYLLTQIPNAPSLLLAWTANPIMEEAAAEALSGAPISGHLPIPLPPFYPIGHGLLR